MLVTLHTRRLADFGLLHAVCADWHSLLVHGFQLDETLTTSPETLTMSLTIPSSLHVWGPKLPWTPLLHLFAVLFKFRCTIQTVISPRKKTFCALILNYVTANNLYLQVWVDRLEDSQRTMVNIQKTRAAKLIASCLSAMMYRTDGFRCRDIWREAAQPLKERKREVKS